MWSTNFVGKNKPDFFRTKLIWVGSGSGLGLELVSKAVFRAFFEIALLITALPAVVPVKTKALTAAAAVATYIAAATINTVKLRCNNSIPLCTQI